MASVHMELGDTLAAFAAFDAAIEQDQDDPDIYYHRGQGKLTLHVVTPCLNSCPISSFYHAAIY